VALADGDWEVLMWEQGCVGTVYDGAVGHGDFERCGAGGFVGDRRGGREKMVGGACVCISGRG
jgi:hypothetical protein